ncbi:ABC transporter ATP-binding protein [Agromyces intestinalis]|uniref:ABC transporter ATP-binding protein n=1 Tax=Agromyces intestinalis TaxID=2592652 RepID=A0A5C1YFI7_9MICO|nr:ABC transporter ATP-binding protein [Agromyces intestinalis]QEO14841.1 ABC transporter ATP-binding protein [Agromyces intestinalis]
MTAAASATATATAPGLAAEPRGLVATVRRGLEITPELGHGIAVTLLLAVIAATGRIVTPVAIRYTVDEGIAGGRPDLALVSTTVAAAFAVVLAAGVASWGMNRRLVTASEAALAGLRAAAFRHVHRLDGLSLDRERRGSLVSRVTSDVDAISNFTQSGGVTLLISVLQLVIATGIMCWYSWPLTVLVLALFLPVAFAIRAAQRRVAAGYRRVRRDVGAMLSVIAETIVGAAVIRSTGASDRIQERVDAAIDRTRDTQVRTLRPLAVSFSLGELVGGLSTALVVVVGVLLSTDAYRDSALHGWFGSLTVGELLAFVFLITFFSRPIQQAVEIINEAQNAIAGWGRVLELLDEPIAAPEFAARARPAPGAIEVRLHGVRHRYPSGPRVLHDLDLRVPAGMHVAVVGETGSGKSTFAKLLTRQLAAEKGHVLLGGAEIGDLREEELRRRVTIVPQDGFLFEGTVRHNIALARPGSTEAEVRDVLDGLGLLGWVDGLPDGLDTEVGQRGDSLSAGERQLVALARAAMVRPDLLILDEATSAVDPAVDARLRGAIDRMTAGCTTVTIAHRLATAETADLVLVFDRGRIIERGRHADLLGAGGVYARLHESWRAVAQVPGGAANTGGPPVVHAAPERQHAPTERQHAPTERQHVPTERQEDNR